MPRIYSSHPHRAVHQPAILDRPRAVQRKKKPYKVVFESVTQEKKKLHSVVSYNADAPPGYWFVAVGYPDLTNYCKEECRRRNLDVHVVSAKPRSKAHADPEKISHHVHRLGYHFPIDVLDHACTALGYGIRGDKLVKISQRYNIDGSRLAQRLETYHRDRLNDRPMAEMTDTETNEQVRSVIRDLFPKIPEADLGSIVRHAFEKDSKRVGNAKELTLARRVQLAVVAHIRHTYTDYDSLLKTHRWPEARSKVERVSLTKLREWRDEDDADREELEETFREIIVIDDDDDEDSSDEDVLSTADERDSSLEIISSRANAHELQYDDVDVPRPAPYGRGRASRVIVLRPVPPPHPSSRLTGNTPQFIRAPPRPLHTVPAPLPSYTPSSSRAHSRPLVDGRYRTTAPGPVRRAMSPRLVKFSDGRLYNLQPIEEPHAYAPVNELRHQEKGEYVASSLGPPSNRDQQPRQVISHTSNHTSRSLPVSRRPSEQDVAIPSIEHDADSFPSPRRAPDEPYFRGERNSVPTTYPTAVQGEIQSPKRRAFADPIQAYEDRDREQASKRMRPVYPGYEVASRPGSAQVSTPRYEVMDFNHRPQERREGVIDLTSSPTRPNYSRETNGYMPHPSYEFPAPLGHLYAPVSSREPFRRDGRSAYYKIPASGQSRGDIPDPYRILGGQAPPLPREYTTRHLPAANGKYLRDASDYNAYIKR